MVKVKKEKSGHCRGKKTSENFAFLSLCQFFYSLVRAGKVEMYIRINPIFLKVCFIISLCNSFEGAADDSVFLDGEVRRPGVYHSVGILEAIYEARGLTDRSCQNAISIRGEDRKGNHRVFSRPELHVILRESGEDLMLPRGWVVRFPESALCINPISSTDFNRLLKLYINERNNMDNISYNMKLMSLFRAEK